MLAAVEADTTETSIAPVGTCPALTAGQKTRFAKMKADPTKLKPYLVKAAAEIRTYQATLANYE